MSLSPMSLNTGRARCALAAFVAAGIAVFGLATGSAEAQGGTTVSATPSAVMPYLASKDSTIVQIVQCGSLMYAVGHFSKIGLPGYTYTRSNVVSFSATTGRLTKWRPTLNNTVESVALSSDCKKVYLAGTFTRVNGHAKNYLVAVSASSGELYSGFRPAPDKEVATVVRTGVHLLVGGKFTTIGGHTRTGLASLSSTTGAATGYLNLPVTGVLPRKSGPTKIYKLVVNPSGTRMLALGNFARVHGHARAQMFMVKLGRSLTKLSGWYAPELGSSCTKSIPYYVRSAKFSPDGQRIYIGSTGTDGPSRLCDAVAAFTATESSNHKALWINPTGCDSLYAVAADATAVYIGGHERWIDNAHGCNELGRGGQVRQGIGAVAPASGGALSWNPTRSRGHGADDLLRTKAGLWVASDNYYGANLCGGRWHPGICFFPNG